MKYYRFGEMINLHGDEWYQVQIKRFWFWWNLKSFKTRKETLCFVNKLKKKGYNVIDYDNQYYTISGIN